MGVSADASVRFVIDSTWDDPPVDERDPATVTLVARPGHLLVEIESPFYGDPSPPGPPRLLDGLWHYEVVELFVAARRADNTDSGEIRYTELEVSPHGHMLVLLLRGIRQRVAILPADTETEILGTRWRGRVSLPWAMVPRGPLAANAFAMHGSRTHRAADLLPGSQPDFHQPHHFRPIPLARPDARI